MHILFLDESGKPSDRTLLLESVVVQVGRWAGLRACWEEALAAHGWSANGWS